VRTPHPRFWCAKIRCAPLLSEPGHGHYFASLSVEAEHAVALAVVDVCLRRSAVIHEVAAATEGPTGRVKKVTRLHSYNGTIIARNI
jgi:hypothetical protein